MCVYFQKFKFGVQAPLVEIGLTIWQKMGAGLKHGQKFIYILISTFSLHGKKGMQLTTFFKCVFIFKSSNLVSKPPWLRQGYPFGKKMGAGLKHGQQFHISF